jgi:hypothetical protein
MDGTHASFGRVCSPSGPIVPPEAKARDGGRQKPECRWQGQETARGKRSAIGEEGTGRVTDGR